jgi:hypothetical protein
MVTRSAAGQYDFITGAFEGGTIVTKDAGPNCTNQLYHVTGMIGNVTTSTTTGGTGTFDVILTHYRVLLFGRCITYSASVGGTVSFVY